MVVDYLPEFMRGVKELHCIMRAEEREFDGVDDAVKRGLDCTFAASSDIANGGLVRWERLLGIVPKSGEGSDDRRREILSRLSDRPPITLNTLNAALTRLYGEGGYPRHLLEVDYVLYRVWVVLDATLAEFREAIERHLRARIPANMEVKMNVGYKNRYQNLTAYTHEQLSSIRHSEI